MTYPVRLALLLLSPIAVTLITGISGCNQASEERSASRGRNTSSLAHRPLITLGFRHPIGITITMKHRQPLMDHLTAHTPYRFRTLFSSESERTVGMLEQRLVEVTHLSVVSYLEAHRQFGAVPLVRPLNRDGEPVSRSVFVTREDSTLGGLADLRERSLALGAFHSTLSNLIPRHELIRAGVSIDDLGAVEHFANDEEVAALVLAGRFEAGAVEDVVADRYAEKGLRVLHVSDPIPSAPLVIRDDLPQRVSRAIREALLKLDIDGAESRQDWDEEFRYGFRPATDTDYERIREIVKTAPTRCEDACHGSL